MDNLQKLIVTFFILTIVFSVGSLLMFFIEVPYKSVMTCKDNNTAQYDGLNSMLHNNGKMRDCVWSEPKDPSVIFNSIINTSILCGTIFLILSAYAFYRKSSTPPTLPPSP